MRVKPSGAKKGIFGLNTLSGDDVINELIITEGEFDAMAAYQATGIPAISLPSGANHLPNEVLQDLENV